MDISAKIAARRKELGLTQEELAEAVGVGPLAVRQWENGWHMPDVDQLRPIAKALKMSTSKLIDGKDLEYKWVVRDQLFSETHMFTRLKTMAEMYNLKETYKALYYIREQHAGQYRKKMKYSSARIPYIIHPLMTACHAASMGIMEDEILAALLLHDVCEDCGVTLEELPFSEGVKDAVDLVTKKPDPWLTPAERKELYYRGINGNRTAMIVKILDRCNNVSTMAQSFDDQKLSDYIKETEEYILPMLVLIKKQCPEYNNAVFLIKYHMLSVLESLKNMLMDR